MIFTKKKEPTVRTGDLVARGVSKTVSYETTDFNKTFQHIYNNIRKIR